MRINLRIEELVLHGVAAADRERVAAALQGELSRLLTERGLPPALGTTRAIPALDGGSLAVTSRTAPAALGRQTAAAVYRGLKR